jgi:hypothetical protein
MRLGKNFSTKKISFGQFLTWIRIQDSDPDSNPGFEPGSETNFSPDPDPKPDPKFLFRIRNTGSLIGIFFDHFMKEGDAENGMG